MSVMKYSTKITLYNSYFDKNDRLSFKAILSIFQDVASIHAEDIGVGYKSMLNKNLYWVLSRIKIDILKMPEINQTVVVETWPHEKGRVDFDRDLKICSEDGEVLVIGTSKWCVIDTVQRRLQRADNVNYIGEVFTEVNYEQPFGKIILPDSDFIFKFKYNVLFSDLDHNQHMNNTNYANLVASAVENEKINHFEINFLNECKLNDQINVVICKNVNQEYVIGSVGDLKAFTAIVK